MLLAAIVDSSDDAILSKNLEGIITSWNRGAERLFGYTSVEAIGQPIEILIPVSRLCEAPQILEKVKHGESVDHLETIRRAKDGRLIHVSLTISPIRDLDGTIIGASKVARDITAQLEMTDRMRRSEARFRVTLTSIADAVIATDEAGRITFMNPPAEHMTGWSHDSARGMPLSQCLTIVDELTWEPFQKPVETAHLNGHSLLIDKHAQPHALLVSQDGTQWPVEISVAPIRETNGDPIGEVVVFRDATERRAAERSAQRLAAIVHGSDDAIIGKNLFGKITNWNEGAERIFGYTEKEIVGKSILTLIPQELQEEEAAILGRLRNGERIEHFETVRIAKDGHRVEVSLTVSPIKDRDGFVIGASKIARDITDRKRVENELREAQAQLTSHAVNLEVRIAERTSQLHKSIQELEAFSYSLSHDLRAPLRAIQSYLEIVMEDYGGKIEPEGSEMLGKVIGAAKRMDRMVLDLLAFTRLSNQNMVMQRLDVEQLIRGIILDRSEFQQPNAQISIISPLQRLVGNEASLTQCIVNVLDNAVKFVSPGVQPHVRILSERLPDGAVRLWFEDNGIGIDREAQRQVFQMFQRAHGSSYPGTGIGLAIVRKAAERMGGEVGMESQPGKGTRFWLKLRGVLT